MSHAQGTNNYDWKAVLEDYQPKALQKVENLTQVTVSLDEKQTQTLLRKSGQAYNTQINDLLLTALARSLPKLTGISVNHIVLEGHGREDIDPRIDLSRTVGWFTTMYPVKLEQQVEIGKTLKQTKEMLRQIPDRGIGYQGSLPNISFNYLGQFNAKAITPASK